MIIQILDNRLLYFNPGTILSTLKLTRYFEYLESHPGVIDGRVNRFVDYDCVRRVDMDADIVASVSSIRTVTTESHNPSKAAIYSSQPLGYGIARMHEAFFLSSHIQLRAMHSMDQALAWLGVADLKETILQLQAKSSD